MNWLLDNIEMVTLGTIVSLLLVILGGCLWVALSLEDVEKDKR